MTKDTHPQTADGNPTNSRFNLKRKFLGNIIIMSTLLTTFVPLPVDAYYRDSYMDYNLSYGDYREKWWQKRDVHSGGSLIPVLWGAFASLIFFQNVFGTSKVSTDNKEKTDDSIEGVKENLPPAIPLNPDLIKIRKVQDSILNGVKKNAESIASNLREAYSVYTIIQEIQEKLNKKKQTNKRYRSKNQSRQLPDMSSEVSDIINKVDDVKSKFNQVCNQIDTSLPKSEIFIEPGIYSNLIGEKDEYKNKGNCYLFFIKQTLTSIKDDKKGDNIIRKLIKSCSECFEDFITNLENLQKINDKVLETLQKVL